MERKRYTIVDMFEEGITRNLSELGVPLEYHTRVREGLQATFGEEGIDNQRRRVYDYLQMKVQMRKEEQRKSTS